MSDSLLPMPSAQRLLAGELLLGTFIKTPVTHPVEILGAVGFDFVVLDQEHAPFDRVTVDSLVLAGQAAGIAVLVRVPGGDARDILPPLDCGAQGVLVPHVDSGPRPATWLPKRATAAGGAASPTPRAPGAMAPRASSEHVAAGDAQSAVLAMIEDVAALAVLPEIGAAPGLDAVFIGRGDLSTALGVDQPRGAAGGRGHREDRRRGARGRQAAVRACGPARFTGGALAALAGRQRVHPVLGPGLDAQRRACRRWRSSGPCAAEPGGFRAPAFRRAGRRIRLAFGLPLPSAGSARWLSVWPTCRRARPHRSGRAGRW